MEKSEFYFQWHFINNCNLRCSHCYQEEYNFSSLSLDKLMQVGEQIVRALKRWNMLGRISLTGGEPFLSPYIFSLIDFIETSDEIKQYDILTNGTCVTDQHIAKLTQSKKLHQIQISLDGPTEKIHDSVRGKGVFNKVIDTVSRLKKNNIEVSLMYTLTNYNKDYVVEAIDFAESNNVDAITIERVTPCGQSDLTDVLSKEEIKSIYEKITLRANKINTDLTVRRLRPLWINTAHLDCTSNSKIGGFCPIGLTSLAILWDGTVLPCRRLNISIGNIIEDGIFKIWYESDILWKIRDKNNLNGKCYNCINIERCGGCRAIAYETTGDYMGEDVQCWI